MVFYQKVKLVAKRTPFVYSIWQTVRSKKTDQYRKKISSEAHNSTELFSGGLAIPPIQMRDMVRRGAILAEDFILEGRQVYEAITQLASEANKPLQKFERIFEYGVGCGRVARHFIADGFEEFTGADVDGEMINWCETHLASDGRARFIKNDYLPPISVQDRIFDFVYSISVFTHMTAETQKQWAEEMARIVAPGGRLLVSFLECPEAELKAGVEVKERIDPEYSRSWFGKNGAPEIYYNTFNTKSYMRMLFSGGFDLLLHRERVIRNHQSVMFFRCRA